MASRRYALSLVLFSTLVSFGGAVAAEAPKAPPLGTRTSEFLLAKITVSDMSKSLDFYTKLVGLKRACPCAPDPAPGAKAPPFREIPLNFSGSLADPFLTLVTQEGIKPSPNTAKLTWVGVKVPDARAVAARLKAAGYAVVREPSEPMPGTVFAMMSDPDGYTLELIQAPNAPPAN